jgi:hypothetical protein
MKAIKLKSGKGLAEGTVRKEVNNAAEKITQFSSRMVAIYYMTSNHARYVRDLCVLPIRDRRPLDSSPIRIALLASWTFYESKRCDNADRTQETGVHREDTNAECYCSGVSCLICIGCVLTLDESLL